MSPTAEDYRIAFETERQREYPVIDAFEQRMGYALDRQKMEAAARVLACPVKKNPPSWQHGRVLYAATRKYLAGKDGGTYRLLDVGTAKGYSALCLHWALADAEACGYVTSVDVIDPNSCLIARNTVAEVDAGCFLMLSEVMEPWPDAKMITFVCSTGIDWLQGDDERIHVAFVDGKHTGPVVAKEGFLLSQRQDTGDLAIFDDVHLPDIAKAVQGLAGDYEIERLDVLPNRAYAVAVRK